MTKSERSVKVLVYLRWPEPCFRAQTEDLKFLRSLLPPSAKVVEAKSEAAFLRELPSATHALVWSFKSDWFARALKLKVLATPAAGRECVPSKGPNGVRIHFGHFHGAIMSESVAAFVMAWARGFFLRQPSAWARTWMGSRCHDVAGSTAVILGYGHVGQAIGAKLTALGVKTYGFSRHRPLKLNVLRGLSPDWLIVALPSDTGTDDAVNAKMLAQLPPRCVVINVGRGNAIDEQALYEALKAKRIAGAYLDVRKYEPTKALAGSRLQRKAVRGCAGLARLRTAILMPHAAAFSPRYIKLFFKELKDDGLV